MRHDDRFREIDQAMSRRIEAVFGDPKRHQFYSEAEAWVRDPHYGRRGGKLRVRKTYCYHCGGRPKEHAAETEALR